MTTETTVTVTKTTTKLDVEQTVKHKLRTGGTISHKEAKKLLARLNRYRRKLHDRANANRDQVQYLEGQLAAERRRNELEARRALESEVTALRAALAAQTNPGVGTGKVLNGTNTDEVILTTHRNGIL